MKNGQLSQLASAAADCIKKYNMINFGDSVVIGLSGGPDSVCLLSVLRELRPVLGIKSIHAVHINHMLRGDESMGDEAFARDVAEKFGATFDAVRYDVKKMAAEQGAGEEETGHRLRYMTFEIFREKYGAQRIAVAHNRNDQAETVLMRVIRGTGIHGLTGIEHIREDGVVIRPLLDTDRSDIEAYCKERGLEPHIDSTNLKPVYTRNRLRLNLMPYMRAEFNPRLDDALTRLAAQAEETDDFLRNEALRYLDAEHHWNAVRSVLELSGFGDLHPALAKRVLTEITERIGASHNLTADAVERMSDIALSPDEPREADISDGCYVRRSYGKLWFLRREDEKLRKIEEPVEIPVEELEKTGTAAVRAGFAEIKLTLVSSADYAGGARAGRQRPDAEDIHAELDFGKLVALGQPVFRNRRPGDRFRPVGMLGRKKIQDFFTDRKVPAQMRESIILLAAGGSIVLAGGEAGADCVPDKNTEKILIVEYVVN